jgi:hypothetical protein
MEIVLLFPPVWWFLGALKGRYIHSAFTIIYKKMSICIPRSQRQRGASAKLRLKVLALCVSLHNNKHLQREMSKGAS